MKLVNIRDNKHWRKEGAVYIGRGTPFGNPFTMRVDGTREKVVEKYRYYFYKKVESDPEFASQVESLRGKTLACWCVPRPCHGDIILEYLEGAGRGVLEETGNNGKVD